MADFLTGFAQGIANLPNSIQSGINMGMQYEQYNAQKAQADLKRQQMAGEVLGRFGSVLADAPDEQVGPISKAMISWYAQTRGIKPSKEFMSLLSSDPRGMAAAMLNTSGEGGMGVKELDGLMTDPQLVIGMLDSLNKRTKQKNAEASVSEAMGGPSTAAPSADGAPAAPSPQAGASVGNLQGLQTALNAVQRAMATPGLGKEQMQALQSRSDLLRDQLKLSLDNEVIRTAGQLGIDYATATPQVRSLVQQQVFNNAGLQSQATAQGQAMGGLVNREVAADLGISPLQTVGEARRGTGAGGQPGGQATLPTTAELGDLTQMREQNTQRMKEYRVATQTAEKLDPQLDQLASLLDKNVTTGLTEPMALRMKRLASSITGVDFKDVPAQQLLSNVADSMSFSFLQQIGGNDSNQDREYARSIIASLSGDPKAVRAMVDFQKIANQRVKDREVQLGKFNKVCGLDGRKCSVDFSEYWDDWKNNHSLRDQYDAVLKARGIGSNPLKAAQSAAQPGSPQPVDALTAPLPTTLPNATLPTENTGGGAALVPPRGVRPRF